MKQLQYICVLSFLLGMSQTLAGQRSNLKRDLIAHYLFNGDLKDKTNNHNDGLKFGGLEYSEDRFGNPCGALRFNGQDGYVLVPTSRSLESPERELTVATWFKLEEEASGLKWLTVCCKSNKRRETATSPQYRFQTTRVTVSINTDFTENIRRDLDYEKWYHYAMTYDGNMVKAYVNGRQFFSFPYSKRFVKNSMPLDIGRDVPGELEFFKGSLDDLRIYNRGLNSSEIQAIYQDNSERTSPKPCVSNLSPPIVTILSPRSSPYETQQSNQKIKAKIKNVKNKRQIELLVNGAPISSFKFNPKTEILTANINLIEGNNLIEIIATNKAGQDEGTATLVLENKQPTLQPPVVIVAIPSSNPHHTTRATQKIRATIKNIKTKQQIEFSVNGRIANNFRFNAGKQAFTTNIDLMEGGNVFEITATNSAGEDQGTGTIIYKKLQPTIPPPVVTITTPSNNPHRTQKEQELLEATIKNVTSKNQITFKVNGRRTSSFSFRNGKFSATTALLQGGNIFEIAAKNTAGTDKDRRTIILEKPTPVNQPPVVTITRPSSNPHETSQRREVISATIKNVKKKSQITFKVNGQQINDFNYKLGHFRATPDLIEGGNVFEITAKNKDGSDSESGFIIRKNDAPTPPVVVKNPPTVNIIKPSDNPHNTTKDKEKIQAKIKNITTKSQITFKVNGKKIKGFHFDPTRRFLSSIVSLSDGANNCEIIATNADGTATASTVIIKSKSDVDDITVTYKRQVEVKQPQVTLICYDYQKEDGDIVSVWVNDEVIADKITLKKLGSGEFRHTMTLEPNKTYEIVPQAWNLGKVAPNTMALTIDDGRSSNSRVILRSEIGKSEAIKLIYRP